MQNVKQKIVWLWQNAERILIIVFFLTFSFNIRKVFLTPYSFLNGGFNEYMTMSFSWTDLLMIGTIIIYNIKLIIGQFRQERVANSLLGNVIQNKSSVIRNYYSHNVSRETFYLLIFLGWVGLSIFWSQYRPIAIYRFLTLAEIVLFTFVAVKQLKKSSWLNIAVFALVINTLFQSLLGIAQFIHNESLGLRILGESIIGPNITGVAKIIIDSEKHIRVYGTFPHPNILAGFLIIPLLLIFAEFVQRKFLLNSSQLSSSQISRESLPTKEARARARHDNVPHETFLWFIPMSALFAILLITGLGFFLTFSRSAFLGLFIGLAIYFSWITFSWRSTKEFKINFRFLTLLISVVALATIILINNTSFFSNQSLEERELYKIVSYETISEHPITGVGIGQFILNEYSINSKLESWKYQPVHNVYLLVFSELGIVGFIIFFLFLISIFLMIRKDEQRERYRILTLLLIYCIILSFIIISLFDHYFWDIKQGTLIFVLPLIILSSGLRENEN
jgi:O-antigen ligase